MSWFRHPAWSALVLFALIQFLSPYEGKEVERKYLNPPPEKIEFFHFGFKESLADSLWLRWIQDNDYCQTYLQPVIELSPEDQQSGDSLTSVPRHKVCDNSWSFKMLDAVTKLAPRFEIPYLAGGSTLAILVEDFPGASEIYERGMKQFPKNWQLLYRAAFHFQYNMKDVTRAAQLLEAVADNGGPIWARALAARLYTAGGQLELAIGSLMAYRKILVPENKAGIEMVEKRLADLKAKYDALPKAK